MVTVTQKIPNVQQFTVRHGLSIHNPIVGFALQPKTQLTLLGPSTWWSCRLKFLGNPRPAASSKWYFCLTPVALSNLS